ncbi:MAG: chemotaxis protein CheX [Calditrichaeota bacterium]|nr:chemotaxis protein CheX [Calditrichota bacterium]
MNYELDQISEELTEAISESFENLFFADIEQCVSVNEIETEEEALIVSVDTIAPFKGKVGLIIDKEMSEEIVMEMVGGDFDLIDKEMIADALSEIGNTIVGRFLSKIVPEDEEFSLGFPECIKWNPNDYNYKSSENCKLFDLELEDKHVFCVLNKD